MEALLRVKWKWEKENENEKNVIVFILLLLVEHLHPFEEILSQSEMLLVRPF